jgi:hypothetical protein
METGQTPAETGAQQPRFWASVQARFPHLRPGPGGPRGNTDSPQAQTSRRGDRTGWLAARKVRLRGVLPAKRAHGPRQGRFAALVHLCQIVAQAGQTGRLEITSRGDVEYDSETRFALDRFAAKGFEKGSSGDAITMTNAVNISLHGVNGARFFEARGGYARLRKRNELPDRLGAPTTEAQATVWAA